MKPLHSFLLIVLLFTVSLLIVMPVLAQDETPVPEDVTIVPYGTESEPQDWVIFLQLLGDGLNSFLGGAAFTVVLLGLLGKFSEDKRLLNLLENSTQGLRDSWPPETKQLLLNLGTGVRNVGTIIEEVFDDIPAADKSD